MASPTSTRLWRAHKEAGRPWPTLDEDEVIDYLVMEAVAVKAAQTEKEEREQQKREEWKAGGPDRLEEYR